MCIVAKFSSIRLRPVGYGEWSRLFCFHGVNFRDKMNKPQRKTDPEVWIQRGSEFPGGHTNEIFIGTGLYTNGRKFWEQI